MKLNTILVLIVAILFAGCTTQPLKAPCDQYATFCGTKTKINQW